MDTIGTQVALPGQLGMAALFTEQARAVRRVLSLPRVAELAATTRVGTTPHDVVLEAGTHRLLRYRRETPARYSEPVLFCYALINRPYILDLLPEKSIVRRYLEQGFEVYMIDWGVPSDGDRHLSLENYVCGFLNQSIRHVLRERGGEQLHLLGYCMGGTMSALSAALDPDPIRSLTLLAAPIDFSRHDTLLSVWTDRRYFDADAFFSAFGNCPAWFLQSCFLNMNPLQTFLGKPIGFIEQMEDPQFVTNFFAMERWINDNIPVAGETFREFVKYLYQGNQLVRGEFRVGQRLVDLGRITCPLLLLTAKNDHLVDPPATEGIRPHVRSRDVESMTIDAGHVGLVVGAKAQKVFWPQATRWLANRSTPVAQAA